MKIQTSLTIILSLTVFMLSNCTISKRLYRNGYTVFHLNNVSVSKKKSLTKKTKEKVEIVETPTVYENNKVEEPVSVSIGKSIQTEKIKFNLNSKQTLIDSCGDLIILKDGSEILAKVEEVNSKTVRYKRCNNLDGPEIFVKVENLFMIKYANGTKEIFKKEPEKQISNASQNSNYISKKNQAREYNAMAIASFACLPLCILGIGFILCPIFGIIALIQFKNNSEKYKGKWMAIVGIVLPLLLIATAMVLLGGM